MSSEKQVKYANKMIESGFVNVRSWVPVGKVDKLKSITKAWRDDAIEQDQVVYKLRQGGKDA